MDPITNFCIDPISRGGELPLLTISPEVRLNDAIQRMQEFKVGCIVVADADDKPIGVITERDILRRLGTSMPLDVPVREACSKHVWSVKKSDSQETAIRKMQEKQCRHLIVLDDEGKVTGVLSVKRLIRNLVDHFPSAVYNLPPNSKKGQSSREGA